MVAQRIVSNDDLIELYHQQGVVLLANAIKPSLLHTLSDLFASCLTQPTPLAHQQRDHRFRVNNGNYHDSFLHICFEEIQNELNQWDKLSWLAQAMQSHQLGLFNVELSIKTTNNQCIAPWHPSVQHWPIKGQHIATLWIPLDPISPESGGLSFSRKHSRQPSAEHNWACHPGDAILYDANTIHREHGNHCHDFDRRILRFRIFGDQTHYHPKPFSIPLLWAPKLKPGEPLQNDPSLFPLLSLSRL